MCPWGSNIDGRSFTFKSRWIHCRAQNFAVTRMEVWDLINHEFHKRWMAAGEIRLLFSKRFLGSDCFLFLADRDYKAWINAAVHFGSFIFLSFPILYPKDKRLLPGKCKEFLVGDSAGRVISQHLPSSQMCQCLWFHCLPDRSVAFEDVP